MSNLFDTFWGEILSREPSRIKSAFNHLEPEEQRKVVLHLEKMVSEDDWHPEQVTSAQAALEAISNEQ